MRHSRRRLLVRPGPVSTGRPALYAPAVAPSACPRGSSAFHYGTFSLATAENAVKAREHAQHHGKASGDKGRSKHATGKGSGAAKKSGAGGKFVWGSLLTNGKWHRSLCGRSWGFLLGAAPASAQFRYWRIGQEQRVVGRVEVFHQTPCMGGPWELPSQQEGRACLVPGLCSKLGPLPDTAHACAARRAWPVAFGQWFCCKQGCRGTASTASP